MSTRQLYRTYHISCPINSIKLSTASNGLHQMNEKKIQRCHKQNMKYKKKNSALKSIVFEMAKSDAARPLGSARSLENKFHI